MKRLKLLSSLSDKELFEVICHLGQECKYRIIETLQSHNCTCFTFKKDVKDCPYLTVYDYNKGRQDIIVTSVGYTIEPNTRIDLFVIDENNVMWWGDDACVSEELWDIYKELKSDIRKC